MTLESAGVIQWPYTYDIFFLSPLLSDGNFLGLN